MSGPSRGVRAVVAAVASAVALAAARAAEPSATDREAEIERALAGGERQWRAVATADPPPDFGARWPLWYALVLGTAREHADRMPRLLDLATRMQDRDPASPGYGNFRWYWRDAGVTDRNAVEFCGLDLHLLLRLHRDWLAEPERLALDELARHALDGCLRLRVRPTYTNIAILNAANLITLGEALGRPEAADEGYRRLEALAVETWRHGLHEFSSPVYYAVDIEGLQVIERFAAREPGRDLARALLELIWTDVAANWFPPAERLAGPYGRSYDYLRGTGGLIDHARWQGWTESPEARTHRIHLVEGRWRPPAALRALARTKFPRLVRQSWGGLAEESRTHWLLADVTLGASGAGYGPDDSPLTFDLAGDPGGVRGYFIPDGREDPYGRIRYATGVAGHPKPLHLRPFWAAAQRTADAVGLAVYRAGDLEAPEITNLQSHLVMPRTVDGLWLRGEQLDVAEITGVADRPVRIAVEAGDPLVLRRGSAAVGIRFVWARDRAGDPAAIALVGDGNRWNALRLTAEHGREGAEAAAAAAVWVRIGGGLDDESFAAWREAFERAEPATVEATAGRIRVAVAGVDGPVSVTAAAPFAAESAVVLEPRPSRAVLEIDGVDVGRAILERVEPLASYAGQLARSHVTVPAGDAVGWEAETGLVLPGMAASDDAAASGGRAVVSAAKASGSVTWRLDMATAGRRWLWARIRAPDSASDSFRLAATDADGRQIVRGAWHLPRSANWTWAPLRLDHAAATTPIDLPAGTAELRFEPREAGAAVDALWLSTDPDARPPDLTPPDTAPR